MKQEKQQKLHFLIDNFGFYFQVTPQSPEFIPSKVASSPNFYSPYASAIGANNITPVKPSTSASNAYAITPSKCN